MVNITSAEFCQGASNTFAIVFAFVSLTIYPTQALAQLKQRVSVVNLDKIPISFNEKEEDGSSRGRPSRRQGTGSRDGCPAVKMPLTALIPANKVGLSVEKNLTLWFYVPYKSNEISSGEFALQDEADNDVFRTSLTMPQTPGIVSLNLPATVALKVNKKYQWYFKVYCDQQKFAPIFVHGWVQKSALKPELESRLKSAAPRERIALYVKNGIWFSAITNLAKLRQSDPRNVTLANDWANLLKDVKLQNLVTEQIVGEVEIKK